VTDSGTTPWFVSAFDDGYLERYRHRDDAEAEATVDWLTRLGALPATGPILDLCCGGGRHGTALAGRGAHVVGLDLSAALLRHARERTLALRQPLRLTRGSMAALPFRDRAFAGCIHMFTAFGYFAQDDANQGVLREVARTLAPGAPYVLDLFNGPLVARTLVPASESTVGSSRVYERRWFDSKTKRLEKTIEIHAADGQIEQRFESVRILDAREGAAWLAAAGFTAIRTFGDYAGSAFDPERSARLVFVSSRA
jgi:SAM-dependent methyltransferase